VTRRVPPIAAVLLLVAGCLPWWDTRVTFGGRTVAGRTFSAWDGSPAWWLPLAAGVVAGGLWLVPDTRRWRAAATALVGAAGLATVVGRWLSMPAGPSDFGWYAYGPLTGDPVLHGDPRIGLWLGVAGLAVLLVAGVSETRRQRVGVHDVQPLGGPGDRDVEVVDPPQ
jgi:hypothetical protein